MTRGIGPRSIVFRELAFARARELGVILAGAILSGCVEGSPDAGRTRAEAPRGDGVGSGGRHGETMFTASGAGVSSDATSMGSAQSDPNSQTGAGSTNDGSSARPLLPARVRRLTNSEYAASVTALLGVDATTWVNGFPPDSRQKLGFTRNDTQLVSGVLAAQLDTVAQSVVAAARLNGRFADLAPCDGLVAQTEDCALHFIDAFGAKAYRRPLVDEDVTALLAIFRAGGSYDEGIDLVARAILEAPSFVYLTELGESAATGAAGKTTLTAHETASALSYVVTGGPPDPALLEDLDSLATAAGRERQLRRLLETPRAHAQLVSVVREWLGIERLIEIEKDSNVYPSFSAHRDAMAAESISFIDEVLSNGAGTVQELLGAAWTIIDTANGATGEQVSSYYAGYYGVGSGGSARTSLSGALGGGRIGILNQGAFLSRFATATGSHPVLRGVAVMRRLACLELPDPGELNINTVPPLRDPSAPKTTREVYSAHADDPACRSCHAAIDSFGFAFEQYDGTGAFRSNRQEPVKSATGTVLLPVDTTTTISNTDTDLNGDYTDSNALALALANSGSVRTCMARQIFRAATGHGDGSARSVEDSFVSEWRQLPHEQQGNLVETLAALVKSDLFVERSSLQ